MLYIHLTVYNEQRERERGKTDEDRQINRRRNNAADTFFYIYWQEQRWCCRQGCCGYGDSHGYGCGMGIGTMMNPHGSVGICTYWIIMHHAVQYWVHTMILHTDGMTKKKMIYASNKNTQGVGYGYGGFRDSVDTEILWGFPQVFLWVWDGYGH